jgi:hypothetical protein
LVNNLASNENAAIKLHAAPIASRAHLRPWSDDFNGLLEIMKAPRLD